MVVLLLIAVWFGLPGTSGMPDQYDHQGKLASGALPRIGA
jgi:hypothetical protein